MTQGSRRVKPTCVCLHRQSAQMSTPQPKRRSPEAQTVLVSATPLHPRQHQLQTAAALPCDAI